MGETLESQEKEKKTTNRQKKKRKTEFEGIKAVTIQGMSNGGSRISIQKYLRKKHSIWKRVQS